MNQRERRDSLSATCPVCDARAVEENKFHPIGNVGVQHSVSYVCGASYQQREGDLYADLLKPCPYAHQIAVQLREFIDRLKLKVKERQVAASDAAG